MSNPFFITPRVSNKLSEDEYKNLLKNLTSIILGNKLVVNVETETFNLVTSSIPTDNQNIDINTMINSIKLDGYTFNLSQNLLNKISELANTDRLLSEKLSTLEGIPEDLTKNLGELQVKALLSKSTIQIQDEQIQAFNLDAEKLTGENVLLKQQLDESRAELQAIQRQAVQTLNTSDKSKEQLKQLLNQLEQAQSKTSSLEEQLGQALESINIIEKENMELQEVNAISQDQLANLQDQTRQITTRAETELGQKQEQLGQKQEQLGQKQEQLAQTQEQLAQTQEQLAQTQEQVRKADARVESVVESAIANITREKTKGETLLNLVSLLNDKVANVNKLLT